MTLSRFVKGVLRKGKLGELRQATKLSEQWFTFAMQYAQLSRFRPFLLQTRDQSLLELKTRGDLVTAWLIYCRKEYRVLPTDRWIVDAGANTGFFSVYAARMCLQSSIVALEPFPATFQRLVFTIEQNKLGSRVHAVQVGLAGNSGTHLMDPSTAENASQSRGLLRTNESEGTRVACVTLSDLWSQLHSQYAFPQIDLLKMDIEGSEHETLLGTPAYVLQRVRRITLEYHPTGAFTKLVADLEQKGFVLYKDQCDFPNSGVAEFCSKNM